MLFLSVWTTDCKLRAGLLVFSGRVGLTSCRAPEYPYPYPLNDTFDVLKWVKPLEETPKKLEI